MTNNKLIRAAIVAGVVVAALAAAAMLRLHFATGALKNQVRQASKASGALSRNYWENNLVVKSSI
jgi:hypothetical protein